MRRLGRGIPGLVGGLIVTTVALLASASVNAQKASL
jgi:hypothetical protein